MIERYTRPEMGAVWTDQARFGSWLETELAVCEARASRGEIPPEEMESLLDSLLDADQWFLRKDKRGKRAQVYYGQWHAQGHTRAEVDSPHPAGKFRSLEEMSPEVMERLKCLGKKVTSLVKRWRPDVYLPAEEEGLLVSNFGMFPLFMSALGSSKLHFDENDFIAVLFLIHLKEGVKGGFADFICLLLVFFFSRQRGLTLHVFMRSNQYFAFKYHFLH